MAFDRLTRYSLDINEKYLKQKLSLMLTNESGFTEVAKAAADIIITDKKEERADGVLFIGYDPDADIRLPLSFEEIKGAILRDEGEPLRLDREERTVYIGENAIRLTELEFSLLALLYERRDFVSREEILDKIWNNEKDEGIINVYIHYLRQKLEGGGEKIIVSSRKSGYKIADKYKKGGGACGI